jgi:hypothetical protein
MIGTSFETAWFETRGVAALLTMRNLILRIGASRVSKDEATELEEIGITDSSGENY